MQDVAEVEEVVVAEPVTTSVEMVVIRAISSSFHPDNPRQYTFSAEIFVGDDETTEAITRDLAKSVSGYIHKYDLKVGLFRDRGNRIKGSKVLYRILKAQETTGRGNGWGNNAGGVEKSKEWFVQVVNILSQCLTNYGFSLASLGERIATYAILQGM